MNSYEEAISFYLMDPGFNCILLVNEKMTGINRRKTLLNYISAERCRLGTRITSNSVFTVTMSPDQL